MGQITNCCTNRDDKGNVLIGQEGADGAPVISYKE